jgi:pilus assembly protein CpaD
MTHHDPAVASRSVARAGMRGLLIAGLAALLANCSYAPKQEITASIPDDYRQRHPISIVEGRRTLELFVGSGRGGLSPTQRAQVVAFAETWQREATAGILIERPAGGPNERAARDTLKEVLSILVRAGIPNHGVGIRSYPADGNRTAALRLNYPQVAAHAGPCGLWPDDLGPSYETKHFENRPYYNLGCAHQRNLAAMVADPHDLVQPRAEGPAWRAKRTFGADKWRKGESPGTVYPDTQKGAISDLGK